MINIYFQEDVPLHPYIEPYSVVYWILFNRILKYIQFVYWITPVHHTDSQGNTNTGFYIHLSLHIYGTAHPTIASNRASALHDNTTYHYKPESRPPNRIRCGMQGSVYPKLQLPAVDKQIQLVCTTHGTKIIGFLPQFMYTYLIDMAFQILRLFVDEADAFCLYRSKVQ